jgi:hypothetical protein
VESIPDAVSIVGIELMLVVVLIAGSESADELPMGGRPVTGSMGGVPRVVDALPTPVGRPVIGSIPDIGGMPDVMGRPVIGSMPGTVGMTA